MIFQRAALGSPIGARAERSAPQREPLVDPLVLGSIVGLGLVSLTVIFLGNGDLAIAVAPLALAAVVLAAVKVPLRHSLMVLGFLCLTLENPSEAFANGLWRSPFATLGALLLAHLNATLNIEALSFSGLDLALLLLAGIWAVRRMRGSPLDLPGHVPPAPPLRRAALICLAAIGAVWILGMTRDGFNLSNSLWQIFRLVYLPCVFLLFCAGLRGPADARALGIGLLSAALLRASIAIYLRQQFPSLDALPHATTHADSMLFADGVLMVVVLFFVRPTLKNLGLAASTLPVLIWGMIANNRRLAWVELLVALLAIYFVAPATRLKRRVTLIVALSMPVIAIYAAVGWSRPTGVFAPLRTIRSVVDSDVDTSTLWRDLENYNLYYTLKDSRLLGTGFGHPYLEVVKLPDVSRFYPLYRHAPHNSVLGLLAYAGVIGFAAIWLLVPLGVFFAVRSLDVSRSPRDRAAALTTVGVLVVYILHCYGDMGLGTWTSVFTVGAALALTAKLAVATEAWPTRTRAGAA